MAGFVFQRIIMIKQERAVACNRLVAKFYNKKFLNCVNLMRYYKVIPKNPFNHLTNRISLICDFS